MEELNYVAIDTDRRLVCVASPEMPKADLAKDIAKWIKAGLSIERRDTAFVKEWFGKVIPDEN